jgi:hypothetical protein
MADVNAVSEAQRVAGNQIDPGLVNGKILTHYDEYVFPANIFALGDKIKLGKIPKGAKVKAVTVVSGDLGTTGKFKLGYAVTDADVSDQTAALLADTVVTFTAAAAVNTALLKAKLSEEKELVAECTQATDAAIGLKLQVLVEFIVS